MRVRFSGSGQRSSSLKRPGLALRRTYPHKLIYALIWPHVTSTFNIVHRRGTDRAHNYLALIEHREFNGHPIEIITLYLASLQRHSNAPSRRDFILPLRSVHSTYLPSPHTS